MQMWWSKLPTLMWNYGWWGLRLCYHCMDVVVAAQIGERVCSCFGGAFENCAQCKMPLDEFLTLISGRFTLRITQNKSFRDVGSASAQQTHTHARTSASWTWWSSTELSLISTLAYRTVCARVAGYMGIHYLRRVDRLRITMWPTYFSQQYLQFVGYRSHTRGGRRSISDTNDIRNGRPSSFYNFLEFNWYWSDVKFSDNASNLPIFQFVPIVARSHLIVVPRKTSQTSETIKRIQPIQDAAVHSFSASPSHSASIHPSIGSH